MIVLQPTTPKPSAAPPKSLPLYVCPFTVLESSAEQTPWTFSGIVLAGRQWIVKRQRRHMLTADYSIVGHEHDVLIERKGGDFLSSITTENARLRREYERMHAVVERGGYACMIVEKCLAAICEELESPNSPRQVHPNSVRQWVASWPQKYQVPVFFAGTRREAELLAFAVLWQWWQANEAEI